MSQAKKKHIVLTITSDPNYDQRMIRICTSLHEAGYQVTLIGRERPISKPLIPRPFQQIRIKQRIDTGKLFYLTYNLKLLIKLLFLKADAFCAIDLDTILPVYYASRIRRMPRVYDAHELFCDLEEVVSRPKTQKMWRWIERHTVPNFPFGYTVNESYVREYKKMYGVAYAIVRNAAVLRPLTQPAPKENIVLYQGAVNHGRCFDQLIPAMRHVNGVLWIVGEGNYKTEAEALVKAHGLEEKVIFKGYVPPAELPAITRQAKVGITLFVATSLSNKLSLANRFFDYLHAGVPQLGVRYPEYENINREFEVAALIDEVTPETVAGALQHLLEDEVYYKRLADNCLKAREVYNWQAEEQRLLGVYQKLFAAHGAR